MQSMILLQASSSAKVQEARSAAAMSEIMSRTAEVWSLLAQFRYMFFFAAQTFMPLKARSVSARR